MLIVINANRFYKDKMKYLQIFAKIVMKNNKMKVNFC